MSNRAQKRLLAARHDSRRYLKHHPPRRSVPSPAVQAAAKREIRYYPEKRRRREEYLMAGVAPVGRRGPSAEVVMLRCHPPDLSYDAVERVARHMGWRPRDPAFAAAVAGEMWREGFVDGKSK